jgi:putative colanic acid biosynthesis acetyltransferase WcaF
LPSDNLAQPAEAPAGAAAQESLDAAWVDLSRYDNSDFDPGRGVLVRTLWYYTSLVFFESGWLPSSRVKCQLLRWFGSRIGIGVVIKSNVRIKFPWRLSIGDHCWLGQDAWIDNMAQVDVGNHVCISQLVYLCTGSHDHRRRTFNLITKPITVGNGAWVGARATILPGVAVGTNALVAGGSIVTKNVEPATVVAGNPARQIAIREVPLP